MDVILVETAEHHSPILIEPTGIVHYAVHLRGEGFPVDIADVKHAEHEIDGGQRLVREAQVYAKADVLEQIGSDLVDIRRVIKGETLLSVEREVVRHNGGGLQGGVVAHGKTVVRRIGGHLGRNLVGVDIGGPEQYLGTHPEGHLVIDRVTEAQSKFLIQTRIGTYVHVGRFLGISQVTIDRQPKQCLRVADVGIQTQSIIKSDEHIADTETKAEQFHICIHTEVVVLSQTVDKTGSRERHRIALGIRLEEFIVTDGAQIGTDTDIAGWQRHIAVVNAFARRGVEVLEGVGLHKMEDIKILSRHCGTAHHHQ